MDDMPKARHPYLIHEKTCRGRWVWYFRMGKGKRIRLPDDYGSEAFEEAYRAALTGSPLPAAKGKAHKGSIAWLIGRYEDSSAWLHLSPATRYQRGRIFAGIIERAGEEPFADVKQSTIRNGREDRKATPFMANNYLRAVKGLFAWAVEAEYITDDPAKGVKELAVKSAGHGAMDRGRLSRLRGPLAPWNAGKSLAARSSLHWPAARRRLHGWRTA